MKPYDKSAKCPKCGGKEITTVYSTGRYWGALSTNRHLLRTCTTCGYACPEAPKDGIK